MGTLAVGLQVHFNGGIETRRTMQECARPSLLMAFLRLVWFTFVREEAGEESTRSVGLFRRQFGFFL